MLTLDAQENLFRQFQCPLSEEIAAELADTILRLRQRFADKAYHAPIASALFATAIAEAIPVATTIALMDLQNGLHREVREPEAVLQSRLEAIFAEYLASRNAH